MNARFWTFYRGAWVKITLAPGQSLTCGHSTPDDEGYHYETSIWTFDGRDVIEQWANGGKDCDGRIDREGESICSLSRLMAVCPMSTPEDFFDGCQIYRPDWQEHKAERVRDEYAQLANY